MGAGPDGYSVLPGKETTMRLCTPSIRTPFCGKGNCLSPQSLKLSQRMEINSCPWCGGTDKNFRPLRFGFSPCNNSWHDEDAVRANEPCKKHQHPHPCPYCRIEELEKELAETKFRLEGLEK